MLERMSTNLQWGGIHRVSLSLLGLQALAAAVTLPCWPRIGFHPFDGSPLWWLLLLGYGIPWLCLVSCPSRSAIEQRIAEVLLAMLLILTGSLIAGPAQYVVVTWNRPLMDTPLLALEHGLRFDVPRLAHWIGHYPQICDWLGWGYGQTTPQLLILPALLGVVLKDKAAMWELVWHATLCSFLCVLIFGLVPTGAPAEYYNTAHIARWLAQLQNGQPINGLHYGTLQGLISFPSLHVLWAWLFTWSVRRHRWLFAILLPINLLMGAATILLGLHFGVDLLGSLAVATVSVASYRVVSAPARFRLFARIVETSPRLISLRWLDHHAIDTPTSRANLAHDEGAI
jgi:membrane-associated phospholipid phosphatase